MTTAVPAASRILADDRWSPSSWRSRPTAQQPEWPDPAALRAACAQLARLPPLVTSFEIESLRRQLAEAAAGQRFILQGGECAETFEGCEPDLITARLKILLQMSLVLVQGGQRRVTRIGRFAGQYAKPRSADRETRDGVTLPAYRGDLVNGPAFAAADRTPDPIRLVRGHARAALTLNFVRALLDGGFGDMQHPEYWDLDFVRHSPLAAEYQGMVDQIGDGLRLMETLVGVNVSRLHRVEFFTSHEGLVLDYEEAQTREVPHRAGWWDLSTHFPWIGVRTSASDGGHVEFFRGVENPLGVKVGPSTDVADLLHTLERLDPHGAPGRIALITRLGARDVGRLLPPVVEAVRRTGRPVAWICDPMHGNTETVVPQSGAGKGMPTKTRKFAHVIAEVEQCFEVHRALGTHLGGIHVELTGENVTECTGGARGISEEMLADAYRSPLDPRLNYEQSLELAMLVARRMRG
ncbi:MAG: 3-deoxy-7-phosphoheptulonate synthase [Phycisphaerales bacterium]|nr:3-deoxy-7-phosphoheptulonate synthase [Phycisphaerales bacterium]